MKHQHDSSNAQSADTPGENTVKVIVHPSSGKETIEMRNGVYRVNVKEPADKNKANKAVLKLLSKHFGKKALIKTGAKSKEKTIVLF